MSHAASGQLELWGGIECTVNRVGEQYYNQAERNGHSGRDDDLERFASLGIRTLRYPVLWELTAPDGPASADWSVPDRRLARLRELGIKPIAGLVHHGSGPRHTSLLDPGFADGLAAYAGAVAARYPWLEYYTPVNEPLTTARFSGLYGLWYPHGRSEHEFVHAVLTQCRATVLAMAAIRRINPHAKLVQTDDLGKTYGTPEMVTLADFYNQRRWLAWDLLCGLVDDGHDLWTYLLESGATVEELAWFRAHRCPPDIIGANYYITGERWLDHRVARYPERYVGSYRDWHYADIEAARALARPAAGIAPLLQEAWDRYGIPIAVTEAHLDSTRENQMRWLQEIWQAAQDMRAAGADIRAVTVWALLGSFDWNCLVTAPHGYYESGAFDVRSPQPRPTALAGMMRELASGKAPSHPALSGTGWWRRPGRFFCEPVVTRHAVITHGQPRPERGDSVPPLLIIGANGTLGRAFARLCAERDLACHVLTRQQMDMADPASVEAALARYRPWAVVNAAGYVRVDDAETDHERCFRENTVGPHVLAQACARHDIALLGYSSDLVFDGTRDAPYLESDAHAPLNIYGRSKAEAERLVQDHHPKALMIRTSAFFGPWDDYNFITIALRELVQGKPFRAASDLIVTPTYVLDLVNASLDLLIDGESGVWHLTNGHALTWDQLALKAATAAGVDASRLEPVRHTDFGWQARRPVYSALGSERGMILPSLDKAIAHYVSVRQDIVTPPQYARA